ncbi:flagellar hook protein FliD [Alteromonadales bacterium alter-6D02]|nr:flagellar hook protein FliD [Alteromonadales bacterium alter-6D02]
MSGISFTGIGSGMPVQDLVSAFVEAERVPFQQRINKQGSKLTTNISANGSLKASLSSLADSLDKLKDAENYQLRKASGSDDFVKIESDKTAQVGSYDIKVNNLAQAHKVMSTPFDETLAVGEGKLTFSTPDDPTGFTLDISATDTLSDIRDKINESTDNEDVTATIITDSGGQQSLVMTSNNTGLDNKLSITATQSDGTTPLDPSSRLNDLLTYIDPASRSGDPLVESNLIETNAALDSSITIDGQITLTNATDTFENAIDGITLTAKKAQDVDDDNSKVSVSEDNALVAKELGAFVKSYNEYYKVAKELGQAGEAGGGPLAGDSMLRGITGKLRNMLSQSFDSGSGNTLSLAQLGVESDQYGVLSLDSTILNKVIAEDPSAVQQFFVGDDSTPGFAASTDTLIANYTESGGLIDSRINGYETQLDKLEDDMTAFNRKMENYEARLLSQYNAMDMLVANMNSTSSYLMGQLDNMPGVVKKTS